MIRYIGIDPQGHRRVWADGRTPKEARENCIEAIHAYVARRPDTRGPIKTRGADGENVANGEWMVKRDFAMEG